MKTRRKRKTTLYFACLATFIWAAFMFAKQQAHNTVPYDFGQLWMSHSDFAKSLYMNSNWR